ncbi:MAG: aldo/keto reductase [Cyanobacteria bacterium K_Offshore_surface_m2_239]|nr:aldo/keto reductase [Cyanobacteria bacterium K_Offshore_surface_m2_239]
MQSRSLGHGKSELPVIGLGCMGLSEFYGPALEPKAAIKLLHEALDIGVVHFDTAEIYGLGAANETLLGQAFADRRERVFLASKFGVMRNYDTGEFTGLDGSLANCRRAIEGSLQRLQTDHLDLYYLHRVDPATPIEETVSAMAALVAEGKVGAIGLSEASGATIRRAAKIHPIAAVQSEYSLFSRDIEAYVIPACLEVGASLVAYSPLGRGLLSGRFSEEGMPEGDWRATTPRFQGKDFAANVALARELQALALAKGCTPAQLALAWVLSRGANILALTGTTKLANLKDNLGACAVELSAEEQASLAGFAPRVRGDRYDSWGMAGING